MVEKFGEKSNIHQKMIKAKEQLVKMIEEHFNEKVKSLSGILKGNDFEKES